MTFLRTANADMAQFVYPKHRLTYQLALGGRYNSIGALLEPELRYRYRLHHSAMPLKKEAHLGVSMVPSFTPAVARIGAFFIIKPFAVMELKVGYIFNRWYGTFGHLQSFKHVEDEHYISDDLSAPTREHESTVGHEIYTHLHLLAAVGPIALSSLTAANYSILRLRNDLPLYFHAFYDVLAPNYGWIVKNETDLVLISPVRIIAGVRFSITHALYSDSDFMDGRKYTGRASPIISLGPLVAYTFFEREGGLFNKPTIVLMALWWLRHPYRAGGEVGRGLPNICFAFQVEGDLWSRE